MADTHFNGSSKLTNIYYNGTRLDKMFYNGTQVFQREEIKTITESISIPFYVQGSSSGVNFYYPTGGVMKGTFSHIPIKIISIDKENRSGIVTSTSFTGNLSGSVSLKTGNAGSSPTWASGWFVSGNTITISGVSGQNYTPNNNFSIDIEYTYDALVS